MHGLTKTAKPLVRLVAACHDAGALHGQPNPRLSDLDATLSRFINDITPTERKIVRDAVRLQIPDGEGPVLPDEGDETERAQHELALRITALVRIADGLDYSRTQDTKVVAISDDGRGVEIFVWGGASAQQNASAALQNARLWNSLMLRSTRVVALRDRKKLTPGLVLPRNTVAQAARRIFARQLEQFMVRKYGLHYDEDIEYVHEMRVALRRLRAALRVFRKAVGNAVPGFKNDLKQLADVLGDVRDLDVFLAFLRSYSEQAPNTHLPVLHKLIRSQQRRRRRHYQTLLDVFQSERYAVLKDKYYPMLTANESSSSGLKLQGKDAGEVVSRAAPRMLLKRLKRVTKYDRRLDRYTTEEQHALRIECKRLRYTAEFLADIYRGKLREITGPMVEMQDSLGDVHDADVYNERITRYFERSTKGSGDKAAKAAARALLDHIKRWRTESLRKAVTTWKAFAKQKALRKVAKVIRLPRKR